MKTASVVGGEDHGVGSRLRSAFSMSITSSRNRIPTPSSSTTPSSSISERPDPLYHLVWFSLSSAILLAALLLSIRDSTQVVLPILGIPLPELCLTRRLTGFACPGCGLTRCFISLARGDVAAAWSYNPAGLWLFAVIAFQLPFRGYQLWRICRGLPELNVTRMAFAALLIFAVALLAQWTLRFAGVSF